GSVLIDGFSQPGYAGTPLIELSGQAAAGVDGLTITGAGATVRGLDIDGFVSGAAIVISGPGATGNAIQANFLGTAPTGTQARPNDSGVRIVGGAQGNTVGGTGPGDANLIADNLGSGLVVEGAASVNNRIEGNRIFANGAGQPVGLKFDGSGSYVQLPS